MVYSWSTYRCIETSIKNILNHFDVKYVIDDDIVLQFSKDNYRKWVLAVFIDETNMEPEQIDNNQFYIYKFAGKGSCIDIEKIVCIPKSLMA